MRNADKETSSWAARWKRERQKLRLECRECEVICERVVSPWNCLKSSCPYVYSYGEGEETYFGCLYKVFGPDLDLSAFVSAAAQGGQAVDPYGLLRVVRSPQPRCRVTIEQAYAAPRSQGGCCNPTFFQHPAGPAHEGIRLITKTPPEAGAGSKG